MGEEVIDFYGGGICAKFEVCENLGEGFRVLIVSRFMICYKIF
jgi:hypothetical protein